MDHRALCMLGKRPMTEPHRQPYGLGLKSFPGSSLPKPGADCSPLCFAGYYLLALRAFLFEHLGGQSFLLFCISRKLLKLLCKPCSSFIHRCQGSSGSALLHTLPKASAGHPCTDRLPHLHRRSHIHPPAMYLDIFRHLK